MRNAFLKLLQQYGRTVELCKGGVTHRFAAYISPFTHRNRQYLEERYSVLGECDQNLFLYIGTPENGGSLLAAGDALTLGQEHFAVTVCEPVYLEARPFYIWAILRRGGEAAR